MAGQEIMSIKALFISFQENLAINGLKHVVLVSEKEGNDAIILCPNLGGKLLVPQNWDRFTKEYQEFINIVKPDIIGISFMSYSARLTEQFAKFHKATLFGKIPLIGGGVHPTVFPQDALRYLDAILIGEGEIAFKELLKSISNGNDIQTVKIQGIYTKKTFDNKISPSPIVDNLDDLALLPSLKSPIYIFSNDKIVEATNRDVKHNTPYNGNSYDTLALRGCPFTCSYCSNSAYKNLYGKIWSKIRTPGVSHVMEELYLALENNKNIQFFNFQDDSFFSHSFLWLKEFTERYNKGINLPLIVRTFPGSLNEEKLEIIKTSPFLVVSIGLQSGSRRVLKDIYDRPISLESFQKTMELLNKARITPMVDVILNNPYETKTDLQETINLLMKIKRPYLLELYGLQFYPGTAILQRAINDGIVSANHLDKTEWGLVSDIEFGSKANEKSYLNKILYICPHFSKRFTNFISTSSTGKVFLPFLVAMSSVFNFLLFTEAIFRACKTGRNFVKFSYYTIDLRLMILHLFPFLRKFNR